MILTINNYIFYVRESHYIEMWLNITELFPWHGAHPLRNTCFRLEGQERGRGGRGKVRGAGVKLGVEKLRETFQRMWFCLGQELYVPCGGSFIAVPRYNNSFPTLYIELILDLYTVP